MAGGKGERFWPQSRLRRPKHLLPIVGDKPMLTQTVDRLEGLVPVENVLIITNEEQRDSVLEVCPSLPPENVIAEPVGRDTAAAVGLATVLVRHRDPEATFAMLPADHVIHDDAGLKKVLEAAFVAAETDEALVTVGIDPEYPATGYGYIQRGEIAFQASDRDVYMVRSFREKPDAETAKSYVESGHFLWNAGMFFWRVKTISNAFEKLTPDLWKALGSIADGLTEGKDLAGLLAKHYPSLEKISVDYAIMEKADRVLVLESEFDWDDVGEWPAVARHFPQDENGNTLRGRTKLENASGNIVINDGRHLTTLVGCEDLIVVQTADATLICPRDRAQEIKQLVKAVGADPDTADLT